MQVRIYQFGELIGIFFLLASTAMQIFYVEPLKREIEWRLVAFNTQQAAQIQLRAVFDNQIALMKLMNASPEQLKETEAKRDRTLRDFRNSDADIADYMIAKEGVESFLDIVVIVLFAIGSILAGLGRVLQFQTTSEMQSRG
jgi:hypothetical protein